jgi:hypothetical protein
MASRSKVSQAEISLIRNSKFSEQGSESRICRGRNGEWMKGKTEVKMLD